MANQAPSVDSTHSDYHGDMQMIARYLEPSEAHILCARLNAMGIPAMACDVQLVQTNSLWALALGGVSLRVPADFVLHAKEVMAAIERGEFELGDDFAWEDD
jgi:hypothetical protein